MAKTDLEGIVDFEEAIAASTSTSATSTEIITPIKLIASFASAPASAIYAPKDFAPVDPVGDQYALWLKTAWINPAVADQPGPTTTENFQEIIITAGLTPKTENVVSATASLSPRDEVTAPTVTSSLHLVINAISIGAASSTLDEFIEIYNSTSEVISLADWKLKRVTASGKTENYLVRPFPAESIISSRGYFLIAHPEGYSATTSSRGSANAVYTTASSIASSNTIILYDALGEVVDLVGYGEAAQFESAPAQELVNDGQILTRVGGIDTDHNNLDFKLISR